MITLERLQTEVSEWSHRNFPGNKPHHPLLGIVEEFGELAISGTLESSEDAIADAAIYLADYCGRNNVQLRDDPDAINPYAVAALCHYHLKGEQGIRYTPEHVERFRQQSVNEVVKLLKLQASQRGIDFYAAVDKVWQNVKQRDWQKNPLNAASVAQ